jgi:hypothetical protein
MNKLLQCCLLIILIATAGNLCAQTSDFGIRFGAELSKKLTKKIELQLEEEVRFNQNVSAFDRSMTTLGGSYALNKMFKAGLFYTYICANNQNDGYYESRHRLGGRIQAAQKVNRFNPYVSAEMYFQLNKCMRIEIQYFRRSKGCFKIFRIPGGGKANGEKPSRILT